VSETLISAAMSVAKQSIVEAPIKHATSAGAFGTSALVETTDQYMIWVAHGTIILSFIATSLLIVHTLLKIRSQIRGD
jgi:hypothetical protein